MCCLVGGGRLRSMPIRRPSHALLKQNCTLVSHPCRLIPCGRSPEIFIFSLFGGKSRQVQQVSVKWPAVVCQVVTNEPIDYPLKAFQKPMKRKSSFRCNWPPFCASLSAGVTFQAADYCSTSSPGVFEWERVCTW